MEDKTILITGATDGIGKETAKALAKLGHTIILHGRNKIKADTVRDELIAESGNTKISILIADLLSLSDIKRAANEFKTTHDHLDVLVNNAGAFFSKDREITNEGFEKTITLNLLAPILLTELLIPVLERSSSARIINLSSAMHKNGGKPDFNDFQMEKGYTPQRAYGLSKLYLIWASRYLSKQLREKNITVNVTHPGAVATRFGQDVDKGFFINLIFKIALLFMPKPATGARTGIYLATSSNVENITGEFFGNKENIEKPDDKYYSAENEKKVWEYCNSIIENYL